MREVSSALGLHLSTTFTAVALLDRFVRVVDPLPPDGLLQLLALACMSVAVKFEEVLKVPPGVWLDLAVDPTGSHLYQAQDLQRMEWSLLQTVGWKLHQPNTLTFLESYLTALVTQQQQQQQQQQEQQKPPAAGQAGGSPSRALQGFHQENAQVAVGDSDADCVAEHFPSQGAAGLQLESCMEADAEAPKAPARCGTSCMGDADGAAAGQRQRSPGREGGGPHGCVPGGRDEACYVWCDVRGYSCQARHSLMLAETSLMYDVILPFEYSTVALACIILAERALLAAATAASRSGTSITATATATVTAATAATCGGHTTWSLAACMLSAAAGMPLEQLAPGVETCVAVLERCFRETCMLR